MRIHQYTIRVVGSDNFLSGSDASPEFKPSLKAARRYNTVWDAEQRMAAVVRAHELHNTLFTRIVPLPTKLEVVAVEQTPGWWVRRFEAVTE